MVKSDPAQVLPGPVMAVASIKLIATVHRPMQLVFCEISHSPV